MAEQRGYNVFEIVNEKDARAFIENYVKTDLPEDWKRLT